MTTNDAAVLLFMMARTSSGGGSRDYPTSFPIGARLVNYSISGGLFGATVGNDGRLRNDQGQLVSAPDGGYFAFSWRNPEMPLVWGDGMFEQIRPIMILENGQPVGTMSYERKDGRGWRPELQPVQHSRRSDQRLRVRDDRAAHHRRHQPHLRRAR
jgi:hypothetical protein